MKRNFCFLIVLFLFCATVFSQDRTTTILLVRHAEKSGSPADDPVLSPAGGARAELLARMLENSGLSAIYTSQYARTKLTAEPIARKFHVPLQAIDAANTNKLVDTILTKHSGGTVLVVGHSNTLPEIAEHWGQARRWKSMTMTMTISTLSRLLQRESTIVALEVLCISCRTGVPITDTVRFQKKWRSVG